LFFPAPTSILPAPPLQIVDYGIAAVTDFRVSSLLGPRAVVRGVEARRELVELCNEVARAQGFATTLSFAAGSINDTPLTSPNVLIALHACDTATDDALAQGIAAGARLIVVAALLPKGIAGATHRARRAQRGSHHCSGSQADYHDARSAPALLNRASYRTKVFEFISTEHTAKPDDRRDQERPARCAGDGRGRTLRHLCPFRMASRRRRWRRHLEFSLVGRCAGRDSDSENSGEVRSSR